MIGKFLVDIIVAGEVAGTLELQSITKVCYFLETVDFELLDVNVFSVQYDKFFDAQDILSAWKGSIL